MKNKFIGTFAFGVSLIAISPVSAFAQAATTGGVGNSPVGAGPTATPTTPGQTNSTGVNNGPGAIDTTGGSTKTVPQPGSYQIEGAPKNNNAGIRENNSTTPAGRMPAGTPAGRMPAAGTTRAVPPPSN